MSTLSVPEAVQQLECLQKDGHAVLTWHQPANPNGPISQYKIFYDDDDMSELGIPSFVNNKTMSVDLPQVSATYFILL